MGRLIFLLLLAGLGYGAYTTGVWYDLTHDLRPEPGHAGYLTGPLHEGAWFATNQDDIKWYLDTTLKGPMGGDIMDSLQELVLAQKRGAIYQIAEKTKIQVMQNGDLSVHQVPFKIVKVRLTSGESNGCEGWVHRDDVVDTPLQEMFQGMRQSGQGRRK